MGLPVIYTFHDGRHVRRTNGSGRANKFASMRQARTKRWQEHVSHYGFTHLQTRDPTCWRKGGRWVAQVQTQHRVVYSREVETKVEMRPEAATGARAGKRGVRQPQMKLWDRETNLMDGFGATGAGADGEARRRVDAAVARWMTGAGC